MQHHESIRIWNIFIYNDIPEEYVIDSSIISARLKQHVSISVVPLVNTEQVRRD